MSVEVERVLNDLRLGRPRALSRAISWVENDVPLIACQPKIEMSPFVQD